VAAARQWVAGRTSKSLNSIDAAASNPTLASPGTDIISPQAATLLGQSIGETLGTSSNALGDTLALVSGLLASSRRARCMIGPHVLTPLARREPKHAGKILQLADVCADITVATALAIPLTAAILANRSVAIASLSAVRSSGPRCYTLASTAHAVTGRDASAARSLAALLGPRGEPRQGVQ